MKGGFCIAESIWPEQDFDDLFVVDYDGTKDNDSDDGDDDDDDDDDERGL